MQLRYLKIEHNIPPWEWDSNYPEDMYGRYYEEDINTILQIDYAIHERNKNKKK